MAERNDRPRGTEIKRFAGSIPGIPGQHADLTGFSLLNEIKASSSDKVDLGSLRAIVRSGSNPILARDLASFTLEPQDIEAYSGVARLVKDPKRRGDHLIEVGKLIKDRRKIETEEWEMKRNLRDIRESTDASIASTDLVRTDDQLIPDLRTIIEDLKTDGRPEDAVSIAKGLHSLTNDTEDLARLVESILALDNPREVIYELLEVPYNPEINVLIFKIMREGNYASPGRRFSYDPLTDSQLHRNDRKLPDTDELSSMDDEERNAAFDENLKGLMGKTLLEHFGSRPMLREKEGIAEMLDDIVAYPLPFEHALKRLDFAKEAIPWLVEQRYNREIDPTEKHEGELLKRYRSAALHLADLATDADQKSGLTEEAYWLMMNAEQLIDRLAQEGPGAALKVRVVDTETRHTAVGDVVWGFDGLGPAVISYLDPRKKTLWKSILLLGGRTTFHNSGRVAGNGRNASLEGLSHFPPGKESIKREARQKRFELLNPKDGFTKEELENITKVDAEAAA